MLTVNVWNVRSSRIKDRAAVSCEERGDEGDSVHTRSCGVGSLLSLSTVLLPSAHQVIGPD
jgi:hypothetical protein